jgi:phenylpyruvate tautomerase PptA (4-oxalocrotonate tautomerase family)
MPLVNIYIQDVWKDGEVKAISDDIHEALVSAFKIPKDDYNHRIIRLESKNFIHSETKTDKAIFIEMNIFPGRSVEAKAKLYEEIFKRLNKYGIQNNQIIAVLNEPPLSNWGLNGKPADEKNIGFNLKV